MAIVGIKMSIFLSLISVWGIIMLAIMGGLLRIRSLAFAEDFAEADTLEEVYLKYDEAAKNCFIACGLYGLTFILAAHQWYLNASK